MTSLNPQERALLQEFLQRLIQIRGIEKDPHADALIAQAVAQLPDAAYLLVQRALLLEQALDAAKVEIAQLNDRLRGGGERGFLAEANRWGQSEQTAQRATLSVSGRPDPCGACKCFAGTGSAACTRTARWLSRPSRGNGRWRRGRRVSVSRSREPARTARWVRLAGTERTSSQ